MQEVKNSKGDSAPKNCHFVIKIAVIGVLLATVLGGGTVAAWHYLSPAAGGTGTAAVKVEQTVGSVPDGLKIGIVVSYTDNPAEGRGYDGNAEGISIAKWRLFQAGTNVKTIVVSDQGSDSGAQEAIAKLADANVAGVLAITNGDHTKALTDAAQDANLPIILPYAQSRAEHSTQAWYGMGQKKQHVGAITEALKTLQCSPIISVGNTQLQRQEKVKITPEEIADNDKMGKLIGTSRNACIVITADTKQTVNIISKIKMRSVNAKILVASNAANASFRDMLVDQNVDSRDIYALGTPEATAKTAAAIGFEEAKTLMQTDSK
ncbi:MAG: hypothetical protein Q4A71_08060 [Actinomycetaceae bacterium]|nr:hypothetical protein [Actinomycetaceae bacterium]